VKTTLDSHPARKIIASRIRGLQVVRQSGQKSSAESQTLMTTIRKKLAITTQTKRRQP